jgi:hypothetical protein
VKAHSILDSSILDAKYSLSKAEYLSLSEFEQKLYNSKGVFVIKQPNYSEKISCGLYMAPSAYKIFDD